MSSFESESLSFEDFLDGYWGWMGMTRKVLLSTLAYFCMIFSMALV